MRSRAAVGVVAALCAVAFAVSYVAGRDRTLPKPRRAAEVPAFVTPAAHRDVPPPPPGLGPPISMPVQGVKGSSLHSNFEETRGGRRRHEAIDILAPRGTPVLAADDGVVKKLFRSVPGGITIYQFDPTGTWCYYYAHLDGYAPGLAEGQTVSRGDVLGRVGTTGNAPANTPHLHFALVRLGPEKRWWEGTPIDPYPFLARR